MPKKILEQPVEVAFDTVVTEIERFNQQERNPFGPSASEGIPVTLLFEGPGIDVEIQFYPEERTELINDFLEINSHFMTRHAVIYPATRAMVARQWHRVYAFDVERKVVTDVKLLVTRTQDPELLRRHPEASAWPWVHAMKKSAEPLAWGEA